MGAFPSSPQAPFVPPNVKDVPHQYIATLGDKEGATIIQKRQLVFKGYIEVCSSFAGVVHDRKRSAEKFQKSILNVVPSIFRLFQRRGQRRFVLNSIFYYVLLGPEVKLFQSHMRGLEAISFLSIPGLVVPQTAIAKHMGVSFACIELHHLHTTVPETSRHAAVVKSMLSSALKLRHEPPILMYCSGNGTLVVVDATSLLPQFCAPGASGKYWHCARPELFFGRCATFAPVNSGSIFPSRDAQSDENSIVKSSLSLVLDAAASKKKHPGTPTLNVLAALVAPDTTVLSDRMSSVAAPPLSADTVHYEYRHGHGFKCNLDMTQYILERVVPSVATQLETIPDTATPQDMMALVKAGGLGAHCLGHLFHSVDTSTHAYNLLAVEIVARAAKRWLDRHLYNNSAVCETQVMVLFRGFNDETFLQKELLPFATAMFGQLVSPPTTKSLTFKILFDRVQQQLGVTITSGQLQAVVPRVKVVRRTYQVSAADEQTICGLASKRDDGMAATVIVNAASRWAENAARQVRLVEQLDQRVRAPAENLLGHLLLIFLKIDLYKTFVHRNRKAEAGDILSDAFLQLYPWFTECPHDKLFAMRYAIPLVDILSQNGKVSAALVHVRQLLALGGLSDLSNINVVSGRDLLEDLHRVSVETCFSTRQIDEAALIAQRWYRVCPLLFGGNSAAYCRSIKLLMSCCVKMRNRIEAVRLGKQLLEVTAATSGVESLAMAHAISDYASLTWKRNPAEGVVAYQRALDLYQRLAGPVSRGVCTSIYNIGLASARMNKLRAALQHFGKAKALAAQLNEPSTTAMCLRSENTITNAACVKIQRWYRELKYGQAKSQTTKTDVTTLCSTLSWSDDQDEISSAGSVD